MMEIMISIIVIYIIYVIFNLYYSKTLHSENDIYPSDNSLGFVKPEHRLLKIFSTVSSGSKIKLTGNNTQYLFTKNTIPVNIRETLVSILTDMIETLKTISGEDFSMKTIENAYCLVGGNNQRYIVDFFIFDVKNYYTIRLLTDIVIIDDDIYINYLNLQNGSNPTLMDKYDVKFNSSGILFDSNMFHENIETLLNNFYSKSFKVIGIHKSSLEYSKEDLSTVYSLNSFRNLYFPTQLSEKTLDNYDRKGFLNRFGNYLPPDQYTIKSQQFCPYGISEKTGNCIHKNTATQAIINEPYVAPGVIYERSSNDKYRWLKDGHRGNFIRAQGLAI